MSKHTPEPWPHFVDVCEPASPDPDSDGVVRIGYEDYKRAMICVNACAGLPIEQLEGSPVGGILNGVAGLVTHRDSLLAALKRIAEYPETSQQELGIEAIKAIARVAIEKAGGGEE